MTTVGAKLAAIGAMPESTLDEVIEKNKVAWALMMATQRSIRLGISPSPRRAHRPSVYQARDAISDHRCTIESDSEVSDQLAEPSSPTITMPRTQHRTRRASTLR